MDYRTGFRDGYNAARDDILGAFGRDYLPSSMDSPLRLAEAPTPANAPVAKAKRKTSAYQRRYKAAFKRVSPRYKKKNGQWKTNGFRSAVRAAHKEAKK